MSSYNNTASPKQRLYYDLINDQKFLMDSSKGATTFSISTLSMMDLFATLSINGTQLK